MINIPRITQKSIEGKLIIPTSEILDVPKEIFLLYGEENEVYCDETMFKIRNINQEKLINIIDVLTGSVDFRLEYEFKELDYRAVVEFKLCGCRLFKENKNLEEPLEEPTLVYRQCNAHRLFGEPLKLKHFKIF